MPETPHQTRRATNRGFVLVVNALLSLLVYGLIMLLSRFREPVGFAFYGLLWCFLTHLGLWAVFSRLDRRLAQRWSEPTAAARRVLVYSLIGMTLGILCFNGLYLVMRFVEGWVLGGSKELGLQHLLASTGLGAILSAVVGAVVLSRSDLARWRSAAATVEVLEAERAQLELAALRRQLNPHFLFNCLNTLTSLIAENPDTASKFTVELAEVYRHLLRSETGLLVSLDEELSSARSLAFLFEQRFENAFELRIGEVETDAWLVVPLTLHTLIENAVHHNVATREQPLLIRVRQDDEVLEVVNELRPKKQRRASSGVGLQNLQRSYSLLGHPGFEVLRSQGHFLVRVPLIRGESHASGDRRR